jgi:hypothetical protein
MHSEVSRQRTQSASVLKQVESARMRSVTHRRPFVHAVFFSAMNYIGIIAGLTALVAFLIQPTRMATRVFILCLGFSALTWLIAYFKRRSAHCPLCKGTPLINTGALPHKKALRLFPFNHGVTAILSIIATQRFRCMDCGTQYDLLKIPSHLLNKADRDAEGDYGD